MSIVLLTKYTYVALRGYDCDLLNSWLVTAITNYTQRVVDTSLSATQRQEALKFIDHVRVVVLFLLPVNCF